MNTARRGLGGAGTQTSALGFGGFATAATGATELWNGTSWTNNPNSLGTGRYNLGAAGTQTAGLGFGGYTGAPPDSVVSTEEFTGPGSPVTQTITTS